MRKLLNIVKWGSTLGSQPQAFLSAKWIGRFLSRTSKSNRRLWALRILSLSPHYFIKPDDPKYKGFSHNDYLEAVFKECADSRVKIFEQILRLDVIYSFAMVQHLTDEVFEIVLTNCSRKLKSGGRLVLHIQLIDEVWKTEDQWKADTSLQGKIKYKYGPHCFGRTEQAHIDAVTKYGFRDIKIESIADFIPEDFDDICSQSLLTAVKAA